MLELLTLGDEIACGPKINNHRLSMLLLFIGQNEERTVQTCDQRRVHLIALVLEYICNETSDFIYM